MRYSSRRPGRVPKAVRRAASNDLLGKAVCYCSTLQLEVSRLHNGPVEAAIGRLFREGEPRRAGEAAASRGPETGHRPRERGPGRRDRGSAEGAQGRPSRRSCGRRETESPPACDRAGGRQRRRGPRRTDRGRGGAGCSTFGEAPKPRRSGMITAVGVRRFPDRFSGGTELRPVSREMGTTCRTTAR